VGVRYRVSLAVPAVGGSYAKHPVTGVSWFGAVKFCNWLTLEGGRSLAARCYREGTNALDWTPITAPEAEWSCGRFSAAARAGWLRQRGFRLPMDNCDGAESASNPYNEFYKAAAWNGRTNMPYGFGREQLRAGDANYLDDGVLQRHDTTPVGFYGGSVRDGTAAAHPEANAYGIWDLSGNVAEWLNDPAGKEFPHDRACYGGSWMFALAPVSQRLWVSPHFTDNFRGFRVATTFCEPKQLVARVPYRLCLREDGELVSGGRQARASGPAAAGR
jgi:hypothetical protein